MRLRLSRLNIFLGVVTFIVVIYAEWVYPAKAFEQCKWPLGQTAKHIALIADPQLVDAHTYPGRNTFFMWFTRVVSDRYMARNFRLLNRKLQPDAIFFLGDLFDGGRQWEDRVWEAEYRRWNQVFPTTSSHFMNLPGNHDVGSAEDIIPSAFERFKRRFGDPNQVRTIGDHSIVTLDTNSLMNEKSESVNWQAKMFLEGLKENQQEYDPIIILTHIPLYRTEGSYCGFEREGRPLKWEKGDQYITEVGPALTQDIIYGLKPALIFSGDDHDACRYIHRWGLTESVEENTVKTFSMAMGVHRPGFQLLSLDTRSRHATDSCLLAKPFQPIIIQGVYAGVVLAGLLVFGLFSNQRAKKYNQLPVVELKRLTDSRDAVQNLLSKAAVQGALTVGLSWLIAQFLINWWSYSLSV